ncbi:MAG: aminopeptidase, partial [Bdellovibrionales bacterium]|nr:aminopeptidase [Bdellovibrionales bacterium]
FVLRASYEEVKILLARTPIDKLLASDKTDQETKNKLTFVTNVRKFAQEMGLDPKESFTLYTEVKKDPLAWVFMAAKPDSFSLKTWWFPFVGSVPYKGFFEEKDALAAAKSSSAEGWETWVRGTDAFSTLGWFNDPLLSTTLKRDQFTIANTVIHEIFHSTFWVKDQVEFNESAANFIGVFGMLDFYKARKDTCLLTKQKCQDEDAAYKSAKLIVTREEELASFVNRLYSELESLYSGKLSKPEIMKERINIFNKLSSNFKAKYPGFDAFKTINNAELMQYKIYLSNFGLFKGCLNICKNNWECFIDKLKNSQTITEKMTENQKKLSPFDGLALSCNIPLRKHPLN